MVFTGIIFLQWKDTTPDVLLWQMSQQLWNFMSKSIISIKIVIKYILGYP